MLYALRYPDNPEDRFRHYAGWWVALDYASGGYPYGKPDVEQAKFWHSEKDARDYAASFPREAFEVYVVTIQTTKIAS